MRIFVLGASGMLGKLFCKHLQEQGHCYAMPPHRNDEGLELLDATDFNHLLANVKNFGPDVIVNFVAICDMEKCESDPASAVRVNTQVSANATLIASMLDIEYMFISSACVFDGKKYSYDNKAETNPVSVYGKTKLMGEAVSRTIERHYVVRSEWCFGGGPEGDAKFLGKLYRQIKSGATEVRAVADKVGSLSYIADLCRGIEKILEEKKYGTYHITCKGSASRYEVACEFVRLLGLQGKVSVKAVPSSAFKDSYFAPRPESERLINTPIAGFEARDWKECLAEYALEFTER